MLTEVCQMQKVARKSDTATGRRFCFQAINRK